MDGARSYKLVVKIEKKTTRDYVPFCRSMSSLDSGGIRKGCMVVMLDPTRSEGFGDFLC